MDEPQSSLSDLLATATPEPDPELVPTMAPEPGLGRVLIEVVIDSATEGGGLEDSYPTFTYPVIGEATVIMHTLTPRTLAMLAHEESLDAEEILTAIRNLVAPKEDLT